MIGALFLAASLTPSLIPRSFLLQGVLGGVCFAIGYGVGVLCREIWAWLELPFPNDRVAPGPHLGRRGGRGGDRAHLPVEGDGLAELDPRADGHAPGRERAGRSRSRRSRSWSS